MSSPPLATPDTASMRSGRGSNSFKRVYQACENCREKKQKCIMGNPASPVPPCQSCRRANLPCVLPAKKRKGRPPKRPREKTAQNKAAIPSSLAQERNTSFTMAADFGTDLSSQHSWRKSMTSFDPVVYVGNASTESESMSQVTPPGVASSRKEPTSHDRQIASRTLATFPLRNTADAIKLLGQAEVNEDDLAQNALDTPGDPTPGRESTSSASPPKPEFFLLAEGYVSEAKVIELFSFYLGSVHAAMPLIPYNRMPIAAENILGMARQEPHFMSAILVVTAALKGDHDLHTSLWRRTQRLFGEAAILGADASTQVIEGLILLSEYPPNMGRGKGMGFEDQMCWMTVGTAVRLGYLLGFEQLGTSADDVDEKLLEDRNRGKVAWSYCYCLDRQISIRLGKSFWYRSPGMTHQHQHQDPAEDFPEMRSIPGIQDDYAAYIQCLLHLTQIFGNAHDLLYPSKSRSAALAKSEHYYKHVDDFSETLSAFRNRWQKKPWQTYPINECVWISFHHLRLYIYSFSLQAYLQRVSGDSNRPVDYFPVGLMGSSDARFIVEAINAAADVLRLAIGRLQPSGALACLPLRFFLFFSHAGVFLLKAAVIIPLPLSQKRAILRLIRALITCISKVSTDPAHPGVWHAAALDRLLGRIYRARDLQTPAPTRPASPPNDQDAGVEGDLTSAIPPIPDDTDLPALLGSKEAPFVPERPLQDLAADMDALFGLAPNDPMMDPLLDLPPAADNQDQMSLWPPLDPFASLFSGDDRHIWEPVTGTLMDWNVSRDDMGTV